MNAGGGGVTVGTVECREIFGSSERLRISFVTSLQSTAETVRRYAIALLMLRFVHWFVRWFVHSFARSFVHSFIRSRYQLVSFIRLFCLVHSFVPSFLPSHLRCANCKQGKCAPWQKVVSAAPAATWLACPKPPPDTQRRKRAMANEQSVQENKSNDGKTYRTKSTTINDSTRL